LANAGWLPRQSKQTRRKLVEKGRVCMAMCDSFKKNKL